MGHCYGFVGAAGAHVVYDNCRGIEVCDVTDFLPVCAVSRSHQSHPGGVLRCRREPDVWVARLSVLQEGRHQDQTSGFFLGRVFAVSAALGFLCLDLRSDGVQIGDVDKSGVPFLFLCYREVQAQQVDEAKRQQPRRESQTAASSDEGQCHCGAGSGWMSTESSSLEISQHVPLWREALAKHAFCTAARASRQPWQARCLQSLRVKCRILPHSSACSKRRRCVLLFLVSCFPFSLRIGSAPQHVTWAWIRSRT